MNKKIIPIIAGTLIILVMALCIFTNKANAVTGTVYNVTTGLLIRETPSTSAKILDSLLDGASLDVLGEEGNYYKIKYNDITGYVTKDYVKVNGDVPKTSETKTENKTENTTVNKVENTTETKTENKVEETNVSLPLTDIKSSAYKAKLLDKATIYVLPLVNATKIGEIEKGKEVTVISKAGSWCYIQTDTINGWLFTSRVEKVDAPVETKTEEKKEENKTENTTETKTENKTENTTETKEEKTSTKKMYVAFEYCNVREKASIDSAKVTTAKHNTEVEVLGKENGWYKVKVNGQSGYIREDQLSESKT